MYKNKSKGLLGGVFIAIIVVVIVALFAAIYFVKSASQVNIKVNVHLRVDDSGSWALSFMKAENPSRPNIESFALAASAEDKTSVEPEMQWIKESLEYQNKMDGIKRSITIQSREIGESSQDSELSSVIIPLPGGGINEIKIKMPKEA